MISYKNPSVRSYRSSQDLHVLKSWFYDFEAHDNRRRAIHRTNALLLRGKMPHGVEATALLTSAVLNDHPGMETSVVQMTYACALVRFVNGLLDPHQSGQGVVPNAVLAQMIGLPFLFVELRNLATHDSLPSVDMCRIAAKKALGWLWDRYWSQVDAEESYYSEYRTTVEYVDETGPIRSRVESVAGLVRAYKKQRKQQQRCVKQIAAIVSFATSREKWHISGDSVSSATLLCGVLIHCDFLVYNKKLKEKRGKGFNTAWFKLYAPLLEALGRPFQLHLLLRILLHIREFQWGKGFRTIGLVLEDNEEVVQLLEWVGKLYVDVISPGMGPVQVVGYEVANTGEVLSTGDDVFRYVWDKFEDAFARNEIDEAVDSYYKVCQKLAGVKELERGKEEVEAMIQRIEHVRDKKRKAVPSLNDILGETRECSGFLFEEVENWVPTPFGVIWDEPER